MKIVRSRNVRYFGFIIGLIFLLSFISVSAQAKTYSDAYLLSTGVKAYERDDLVTAVMYLFAYKERNPALLQKNPEFRKELIDALDYCIVELKKSEMAMKKNQRNKTNFKASRIKKIEKPSLSMPARASKYPLQLAPMNKSVFNHFPRTTILKWEPLKGAASYTVEIDCFHCCASGKWCSEMDGNNTTIVSNLHKTEHVFDFAGAQPGRWRVWAVYENGKAGVKSPWWEFRYTK